MLAIYEKRGFDAALQAYGVKTAAEPNGWNHAVDSVVHTMTGNPAIRDQLLQGKAFGHGGAFNPKEFAWPTQGSPTANWMGRGFNALTGYSVYKDLKGESGDPNEGRVTNALTSLGGLAGGTIGNGAAGILGAGVGSSVGSRIGRGLGRVLGSSAE